MTTKVKTARPVALGHRKYFFNLARLEPPAPEFDLAELPLKPDSEGLRRASKGFETRENALAEEGNRISSLKLYRATPHRSESQEQPFTEMEANWLADWLERGLRIDKAPKTYASFRFMREFRRRYVGAVRRLEDLSDEEVVRYTLVSTDWRIRGDALADCVPKRLLERVRVQLYRAGLASLPGWLAMSVHGEYDEKSDQFALHVHAFVCGRKAEAFEKLRTLATYEPGFEVRRPIVAQTETDGDPLHDAYFLAQSFWGCDPVEDEQHFLGPKRIRIPEPRHAEWLMWASRQTFSAVFWLHGCRIADGKIVQRTDAKSDADGRRNGPKTSNSRASRISRSNHRSKPIRGR